MCQMFGGKPCHITIIGTSFGFQHRKFSKLSHSSASSGCAATVAFGLYVANRRLWRWSKWLPVGTWSDERVNPFTQSVLTDGSTQPKAFFPQHCHNYCHSAWEANSSCTTAPNLLTFSLIERENNNNSNNNNNNGYFQMPILKSSKHFTRLWRRRGGRGNKVITQMFLSDTT